MLYIKLNYFIFLYMQDLNIFRIVGTIENLIIQDKNPTTPIQFHLRTIDGVVLKIHVAKNIYDDNIFFEKIESTLVECLGCFEMIENSSALSLKKIILIEDKGLSNPF